MIHELKILVITALTNYLRGLTLREALITSADILIVYYVIYRVLKLIRGTRAAQMLVGVALIAAFFFAARRLELTTVSWLFENLINYFIILLIVIFQHDIQRGLIQVGQNLFRRRQYEETYVIEEVVQAADELSRHRIGGLIVLARDADLADHLGEAGVELDAKVTKELLVTLFIPDADNHMHDGAVIIKNLRVQQAGALLPLSANAKLDKQLGTRHRAAIGITEQTDAVVVVISEERGLVSLCFNGNIARDLAPPTLRKALLGLFQKKTKGPRPTPPRVGLGRTGPPREAPKEARPQGGQGDDGTEGREGSEAVEVRAQQMKPGMEGGKQIDLLSLVVTQPMSRPSIAASAMTPRRAAGDEAILPAVVLPLVPRDDETQARSPGDAETHPGGEMSAPAGPGPALGHETGSGPALGHEPGPGHAPGREPEIEQP